MTVIWKRSTMALTIGALAGLLGPDLVLAACDVSFDNARAKGLTASMVRTFHPCGSSPYPSFPNAETEADTDACTPVFPREFQGGSTSYQYAADGGCQVKFASKLARDCASIEDSDGNPLGLPPGPCHVSRITAKCKDIIDGNDILIGDDDSGWTVAMILRASIDDETNGPMTVIDLPVSFEFGSPERGDMKLVGLSAEPLQELGVFLPACTVLQIMKLEIRDPQGYPFAGMGVATLPEF
jgi:hypothetical protein